MFHILIGTKAQFIKMAPIMQELQRRSIEYNFIDTGQHAEITERLRKYFGIKRPDISLSQRGNTAKLRDALRLTITSIRAILTTKSTILKDIFSGNEGVCLIHGDTLSTLIGLLLAKRAALKIAHIESGLRSFHFLSPFTEELIRLIVMYFSHYLFCFSLKACQNLERLKVPGQISFMPIGSFPRD